MAQEDRAHAARALAHRETHEALHFPVEAEMPESILHLLLRTLLFQLLRFHLKRTAAVGSEQFVYFDASDPKKCLAPDAFVKLGVEPTLFATWKTWQHGAPELAIEIVSESDSEAWSAKLSRYHALGVRELLRFDPRELVGARIRVWDRLDERLVERVVSDDATPCVTLGLHWVVRPAEDLSDALRLAEDERGERLIPTPTEAESRAREAESRAREAESRARSAAEQRVAELEAELRKRGG